MKRTAYIVAAAAGVVIATAGQATAEPGWTDYPISSSFHRYAELEAVAVGAGETWAFGGGNHDNYRPRPPLPKSSAFRLGAGGWQEFPVPNVGMIRDADVVGRNDVWAVGHDRYYGDGNAVHWDGQRWTKIPMATPPTPPGGTDWYLAGPEGVEAFGSDDVWAAGEMSHIGGDQTRKYGMIQHWNGRKWTNIRTPRVSQQDWQLLDISGANSNDVWAVGAVYAGPAVLLHWDGSQWTSSPMPQRGSVASLEDVVAFAPDDVWASGSTGFGTSKRPLLLHFNGEQWRRVVPPPDVSTISDLLPTPGQLWVAGSANDAPALARFDGTSWRTMPAPSSATLRDLAGDGQRLIGVGRRHDGNRYQPFASTFNS